eukprot:11040502-Alexandrium_andersonii.AAC.1
MHGRTAGIVFICHSSGVNRRAGRLARARTSTCLPDPLAKVAGQSENQPEGRELRRTSAEARKGP